MKKNEMRCQMQKEMEINGEELAAPDWESESRAQEQADTKGKKGT